MQAFPSWRMKNKEAEPTVLWWVTILELKGTNQANFQLKKNIRTGMSTIGKPEASWLKAGSNQKPTRLARVAHPFNIRTQESTGLRLSGFEMTTDSSPPDDLPTKPFRDLFPGTIYSTEEIYMCKLVSKVFGINKRGFSNLDLLLPVVLIFPFFPLIYSWI